MKNNKLLLFKILFLLFIWSCSDDNSDGMGNECDDIKIATDQSALNYNNENSTELCNAYKTALTTQINSCGDESGELQNIIKSLGDCTESLTSPLGSIEVKIGTLATSFGKNITIEQNGTTISIRAEDNISDDWISFEIEEGQTGDNVISNFKIHLLSSEFEATSNAIGTFTSSITTNNDSKIEGTFSGPIVSPSSGADLSLTGGKINIEY